MPEQIIVTGGLGKAFRGRPALRGVSAPDRAREPHDPVLGFVTVNSIDFGPWYPWSMSMHALRPRPGAPNVILLSIAGSFVVAALGAWDFSRRDIAA